MNFIEMSSSEILAIFYIWSNVVSIFIFSILYIKHLKNKQTKSKILSNIIVLLMIYFFGDAIWALGYYNLIPYSDIIIKIARMIYYIAAGFIGYYWLLYAEITINSPIVYNKKKRKLLLIPVLVSTISTILICSFLNPAAKNIGGYLTAIALVIVPFIYIIISSIHILYKRNHVTDLELKKEYSKFAIWPLIILSVCILQVFIPELPFFCSGALLVIVYLFVSNQESYIFTDALTGINNRNMINKYIKEINTKQDNYYILMIDIDKFKSINDTYGHLEGDRALKYMANKLKAACANQSVFLGRYGGDEFIIFAKNINEEDIVKAISKLDESLKSSKDDLGYYVYATIGYSKIDSDQDIETAIEAADNMLYEKKEIAHKIR